MAVRNGKGQFEKGSSGNEYGRPVKEKASHRIPASNRKTILSIAERPIEVNLGGRKETMTLFEASLLRLAIDGAQGNRVSARQFTQLVSETAKEDLTMRLRTTLMMDQINRVRDENEQLREKLGARGGVIHDPHHDWSWTGVSAEDRLDDGRTTLDGEATEPED